MEYLNISHASDIHIAPINPANLNANYKFACKDTSVCVATDKLCDWCSTLNCTRALRKVAVRIDFFVVVELLLIGVIEAVDSSSVGDCCNLSCASVACIRLNWLCDALYDYPIGSDEVDCIYPHMDELRCLDNFRCRYFQCFSNE